MHYLGTHDELAPLYQEYDAALKLWAAARLKRQAEPLVTKMVPVWAAYQHAQAAMNDAYEALLTTGDGTWRAQVMRLTGLQADARSAAAAWDAAEEELLNLEQKVRLDADYRYDAEDAPEVEDLLRTYSADTGAWKLNLLDDHRAGPYAQGFLAPAAKETADVIEQQNRRIREVANLVGEPGA